MHGLAIHEGDASRTTFIPFGENGAEMMLRNAELSLTPKESCRFGHLIQTGRCRFCKAGSLDLLAITSILSPKLRQRNKFLMSLYIRTRHPR